MKKIIIIPHLHYKVFVFTGKDIPEHSTQKSAIAWTIKGKDSSAICVKNRKDLKAYTMIAHEIIHVLQFIAEDRGIDFVGEQEHFGYMMQYLLAEIMGLKLETR